MWLSSGSGWMTWLSYDVVVFWSKMDDVVVFWSEMDDVVFFWSWMDDVVLDGWRGFFLVLDG